MKRAINAIKKINRSTALIFILIFLLDTIFNVTCHKILSDLDFLLDWIFVTTKKCSYTQRVKVWWC